MKKLKVVCPAGPRSSSVPAQDRRDSTVILLIHSKHASIQAIPALAPHPLGKSERQGCAEREFAFECAGRETRGSFRSPFQSQFMQETHRQLAAVPVFRDDRTVSGACPSQMRRGAADALTSGPCRLPARFNLSAQQRAVLNRSSVR